MSSKTKSITSFFKPKAKNEPQDAPVKEEVDQKPKKVVNKKEIDPIIAEKMEEKLREFDNCVEYGPVIGITRLERYERAVKFGLDPPEEIKELLENPNANQACYFDQTKLYHLDSSS